MTYKERRTGTNLSVSFNADSLDLLDYVERLAKTELNSSLSYAVLECIRQHRDNKEIASVKNLVRALHEKIDSLSFVGIPAEQVEQVKEEIKEAASFDIDNLFGG